MSINFAVSTERRSYWIEQMRRCEAQVRLTQALESLTQRSEHTARTATVTELSTLIGHYYTAFQKSRMLLERRDRELAEIGRGLSSRPVELLS